jgi:hypothetical protein
MLIREDEYLYFVDRALDGMAQILGDLGDELANRRPALPGANSPYAILTHCLGVLDYWVGVRVAGRSVARDREAEFRASGPVRELLERVEVAKQQLRADLALADTEAPLRPDPRPASRPDLTQGGALIQAYKELAQHHGQLELTRDVLLATSGATRDP